MVTANELLASLLADAHEHPVTDKDTRFVINPDTRLITNESKDELFLMQFDHNSERYTFQLPRYVEGHDMMLCTSVVAHFINIDATTGTENRDVADLTDLQIDPDNSAMVICSWTIKRQSTQLAGNLSFLIQFLCKDDSGEIVYEWHTDIFSEIVVKPGMNNGEAAVIEYTNILEQWRDDLFGAGDSVLSDINSARTQALTDLESSRDAQMSAVEAKGAETLETIPDDYTELYNTSRQALRTRANAIVQTATGETVVANDCSDDYLRGLRIFGKSTQVTTTGKNLLSCGENGTTTNVGLTIIKKDGLFTITGTSTASATCGIHFFGEATILAQPFKVGSTYTYSISDVVGSVDNLYFQINYRDAAGKELALVSLNGKTRTKTFTVPNDVAKLQNVYIGWVYGEDARTVNCSFRLQVEEGLVATTWEPYSGGYTSPSPEWRQDISSVKKPTVTILGKNLLNWSVSPYYNQGRLELPYTSYNSIASGFKKIRVLPGHTYTFSYKHDGGDRVIFNFMSADGNILPDVNVGWGNYLAVYNGRYGEVGDGATFTIPTDSKVAYVEIHLCQMNTCGEGNCNYYTDLQFEEGSVATDYEPYTEQSLSLAHTLPGISVPTNGNYVDENGQNWICDEIDFERGKYIQRIKSVVLSGSSSEYWYLYNNSSEQGMCFVYVPPDGMQLRESSRCDAYRNVYGCWEKAFYGQTGIYSDHMNAVGRYFRPPNEDVNSLDAWKSWLANNPLEFVYILIAPIETPLTDEELYYFSQLHSNYPTTTVMNDQGAAMEVKYNADTALYFNNSRGATDEQVQSSVNKYLSENPTVDPTVTVEQNILIIK